ncbi:hypothetical protein GV827_21550 [Sulfitobacter sp. JBTF-M27]|uniref:Uncharacterized protein n=1 Tax=Sulfitobacter sediminilitoris TaxID=2698830 RepID=A0A6P0CI05_9RHOB|nr:hypothetical protein [Sulfitobacter sediminilitoris]
MPKKLNLLPRKLSFEYAVSWLKKNVAGNSSFGRATVVHTVLALRDAANGSIVRSAVIFWGSMLHSRPTSALGKLRRSD